MSKLSISNAWDETREVLRRDGKLFASVAAALFLLPQLVAGVVTGQGDAGPESGTAMLIALAAALIGIIGQLAIAWLALGAGVSVGEAIRHAFRRALPLIGTMLIILALALLLAMVVVAVLMAIGSIGNDPRQLTRAQAVMIVLLVAVPMLLISVRLMPTVPVASAERIGPIGIIKRSWALTRGHFLRLLGFLLAFLLAAIVLSAAVGIIGGILGQLVFGTAAPFTLGALVIALVSGLVQAGLVLVYVVMLSRIYAQLSGEPAGEVSVPHSGS